MQPHFIYAQTHGECNSLWIFNSVLYLVRVWVFVYIMLKEENSAQCIKQSFPTGFWLAPDLSHILDEISVRPHLLHHDRFRETLLQPL